MIGKIFDSIAIFAATYLLFGYGNSTWKGMFLGLIPLYFYLVGYSNKD